MKLLKGSNILIEEQSIDGMLIIKTYEKETYKFKMIDNCEISGLINGTFLKIDNANILEYSTKKLINLRKKFATDIDIEVLKKVLIMLRKLERSLSDYMLNIDDVCINEDTIFCDDKNIYFIYIPDYNVSISQQLTELFKNILDKIDYRKRDITSLCFATYQMFSSGKCLQEILNFIDSEMNEDELEQNNYIYKTYEDRTNNRELIDQTAVEEHPNKNLRNLIDKKRSIGYIQLISLCMFIFGALIIILGLFLRIDETNIATILFIYVALVYLVYSKFIKVREKKTKQCDDSNTKIIVNNSNLILKGDTDVVINAYPYFIGSDNDNDWVINKSYISRKHAKIYIKNNEFYLEDLRSTNGTYVNNKKVHKNYKLRNGDTIKFAKYSCYVNIL